MRLLLGMALGLAMAAGTAPAPAFAHGGAKGCHDVRKGGRAITAIAVRRQKPKSSRHSPWLARSGLAPADAAPYANCTESRAAGASNIRRGEPGYGPHLDRDNDGVGCER